MRLEQHQDTKLFCRILADQKVKYHRMRSIEVRGYSWPVIWKMIACRDHLWLQHYCYPIPVDETPAYIFRQGENSSLFVPLEGHFNSYWDHAAVLLKYASNDKAPMDNWDRALREATN